MTENPQRRSIPVPIMAALRCPLCAQSLDQEPSRLHCTSGHSFDRAKQGHITLRRGGPTPKNADTPAMVAAREALLSSGLYEPLREKISAGIAAERLSTLGFSTQHLLTPHDDAGPSLVADLGGGTGYYLAGILDRLPDAYGVCVDLSAAALKRAARCHERAAAIGSNLLSDPLPLETGSVAVATSIFGPRNMPEIQRVLCAEGLLAVVTPTREHLSELVEPLGMVQVDPHKNERLAASLTAFRQVTSESITYCAQISLGQARSLVGMGPSAHHISSEELDTRLSRIPDRLTVTVSVNLGVYAPAR